MPTVTLDYSNTTIQDTYVTQNNPTTNFGAGALRVDVIGDEIYIKFNFGLIPNDAIITSATLKLTSNSGYGDVDISLYDILSPWEESAVTWNTKPTTKFEATFPQKSLADTTQVNIPVTSLVQKMVTTGEAEHGFCLKGSKNVGFYAKETTANSSYKPKLEIIYSIPETDKKQVEQVGSTVYGTATADPHNVNIPAGIKVGDTLVASFSVPSGVDIDTPAGWQLFHEDVLGGQVKLKICTKISDGTEKTVTIKRTGSTVGFPASAIVSAYRNVKSVSKLKTLQFISPVMQWRIGLSTVPVNSLVAIVGSVGSAINMSSWTKNFMGQKTSNDNYSTNIISSYNYEKTSYVEADTFINFANNTSGLLQAIALEPITNATPTIDGQDEYLGNYSSPFIKEYSVTDAEDDPVTIVEKLDGVIINTKNVPGLNTIDLTAQWDELSYGKHTVTIEVNDAYDPMRKVVRTWTFLKVLHSDADLITIVKSVDDLQLYLQQIKQRLVNKAGGSVIDSFEKIINEITMGKKWASGLVTNSTTELVSVRGLSFKPSYIIARYAGQIENGGVSTYGTLPSLVNIKTFNGSGTPTKANTVLYDDGFDINVAYNTGRQVEWIAFE